MKCINLLCGLFVCVILQGQVELSDRLFQITELEYLGAFRIPASRYGVSDMNYSEGPIAYNAASNSIFVVGHGHQQAIAEFSLPSLKNTELANLNMATNIQPFESHLNQVECSNSQNLNRIGGMIFIDGKLYVNSYEYYDANGDVTHTTMILEDPSNLKDTNVKGFFQFEGGAGHTAGWMSEVSPEWKDRIGGAYLTGLSSGIPIISRTSVGPSAFSFTPNVADLECNTGVISTNRLLDFSLSEPLNADLDNSERNNDIWTHLSRATYGMIVPGTRTYMTLGSSGGHESGVCYKCVQDDDNLCGGYCAPKVSDYSQFYWLWDMDDLLKVKAGVMNAYDVRPYAYGPMVIPFADNRTDIGGGTYDVVNGILYLTVQRADDEQGTYSNPPVIIGYQLPIQDCVCCSADMDIATSALTDNMNIKSSGHIKSDAIITQTDNTIWSAKDYVELIAPFQLNQGLQLILDIIDCNE